MSACRYWIICYCSRFRQPAKVIKSSCLGLGYGVPAIQISSFPVILGVLKYVEENYLTDFWGRFYFWIGLRWLTKDIDQKLSFLIPRKFWIMDGKFLLLPKILIFGFRIVEALWFFLGGSDLGLRAQIRVKASNHQRTDTVLNSDTTQRTQSTAWRLSL